MLKNFGRAAPATIGYANIHDQDYRSIATGSYYPLYTETFYFLNNIFIEMMLYTKNKFSYFSNKFCTCFLKDRSIDEIFPWIRTASIHNLISGVISSLKTQLRI